MPLGRVNICSTDCSLPPPPILRSSSVRLELLHFWKGYRVLSLSLPSLGFRHLAAFVPPVSQKCLALASVFCVLASVTLCSPLQLVQIVSLLFAYTTLWLVSILANPAQISIAFSLVPSWFPAWLLPFCPFSLEFWVLNSCLTLVWQVFSFTQGTTSQPNEHVLLSLLPFLLQ